jgi:3-keto-disaccharide hydrolase
MEVTLKRSTTIAICLLAGALGTFQSTREGVAQNTSEWTVMFDGTNLNSWSPIGNANWKVGDGVVQADSGNGFLVSKESYADFEIKVEFWVNEDANSGVFIRCENPLQIDANNAYEVNIYDKRPDQAYRTGAIVEVAKPSSVINTGDKWNTFQITARGAHLTVILNNVRTVDVDNSLHTRGPIALQYGAGLVKFRRVEIRRL